jgi:CheY-like chemotaxis protein
MAHILIATPNTKTRSVLSDVLVAVGHRVTVTSDAGLALAILRLTQHPLIVLLEERGASLGGVDGLHRHDLLDLLLDDDAGASQDAPPAQRNRHVYVLLTHERECAVTAQARALLECEEASVLPPTCSIGALLNAIEEASERLALQREVDLAPAPIAW